MLGAYLGFHQAIASLLQHDHHLRVGDPALAIGASRHGLLGGQARPCKAVLGMRSLAQPTISACSAMSSWHCYVVSWLVSIVLPPQALDDIEVAAAEGAELPVRKSRRALLSCRGNGVQSSLATSSTSA